MTRFFSIVILIVEGIVCVAAMGLVILVGVLWLAGERAVEAVRRGSKRNQHAA